MAEDVTNLKNGVAVSKPIRDAEWLHGACGMLVQPMVQREQCVQTMRSVQYHEHDS